MGIRPIQPFLDGQKPLKFTLFSGVGLQSDIAGGAPRAQSKVLGNPNGDNAVYNSDKL
jgi:hypothetical protein